MEFFTQQITQLKVWQLIIIIALICYFTND